jgi:hypothetical protein
MGRYTYCSELKDAIRNANVTEWSNGEYTFRFDTLDFWWKGRRLDITSSRAAHLYYRLVLGRKDGVSPMPGTVSVLRKRYGDGFLEEFLPKMKQKVHTRKRASRKPYTWWDDEDTQKLVAERKERENKRRIT